MLLVRALQLLGSGLTLATQQLKSGQLRPSATVKNGLLDYCKHKNMINYSFIFAVVSTLNTKFRSTLAECKQLNSAGLLAKVGSTNITADKILYNHAIEMVREFFFLQISCGNTAILVSNGGFGRTIRQSGGVLPALPNGANPTAQSVATSPESAGQGATDEM